MVRRLIRDYSSRLKRLVEDGKARGELATELDADAATTLFIGSIQGLVMQSLIAGSAKAIRTMPARRVRYLSPRHPEHVMKALPLQRRTMVLVAVLLPMLALFVYVALRSVHWHQWPSW